MPSEAWPELVTWIGRRRWAPATAAFASRTPAIGRPSVVRASSPPTPDRGGICPSGRPDLRRLERFPTREPTRSRSPRRRRTSGCGCARTAHSSVRTRAQLPARWPSPHRPLRRGARPPPTRESRFRRGGEPGHTDWPGRAADRRCASHVAGHAVKARAEGRGGRSLPVPRTRSCRRLAEFGSASERALSQRSTALPAHRGAHVSTSTNSDTGV
jgi:hypothetical protein